MSDDGGRAVFNSGAAWAGVAVFGGWLVGSTLRGLIAGPVVLTLAVVSYYLVGAVAGSENPDGSVDQVTYFGLVSVLAGPVLGAAGAESETCLGWFRRSLCPGRLR
jgi:hypothetical protein